MKRSLLTGFFAIFISLTAGAENYGELFSYDSETISNELAALGQVEALAETGNTAEAYSLYTSQVSDSSDLYVKRPKQKKIPPGVSYWSGFFSSCLGCGCGGGFFLGPLCVLIVYLVTDNDKYEVKQAMQGCMTGATIGSVVGLVFFLFYYGYI